MKDSIISITGLMKEHGTHWDVLLAEPSILVTMEALRYDRCFLINPLVLSPSCLLSPGIIIGLMFTAAMVYWTLHFFNFTVDIRNVCVLLAPWMASNTAIATYLLAKEIKNSSAGLVAAAFIAVVPG